MLEMLHTIFSKFEKFLWFSWASVASPFLDSCHHRTRQISLKTDLEKMIRAQIISDLRAGKSSTEIFKLDSSKRSSLHNLKQLHKAHFIFCGPLNNDCLTKVMLKLSGYITVWLWGLWICMSIKCFWHICQRNENPKHLSTSYTSVRWNK
jgi:hypothetical protein